MYVDPNYPQYIKSPYVIHNQPSLSLIDKKISIKEMLLLCIFILIIFIAFQISNINTTMESNHKLLEIIMNTNTNKNN